MTLNKHGSNGSFDIDEFLKNNRVSPTDSSCSSDDSLSNSTEFTKQNELLETINEFKELEMKNKTNPQDLTPKFNIPSAPSAPPIQTAAPSAPPAQRNYKAVDILDC